MNSRERVLATLEHEIPDRTPCWCGASEEFWDKAKIELDLDDEGLFQRFGDDFRRVYATYSGPEFTFKHENATSQSVFGIERDGLGYGQPLTHPLSHATLTDIHDYAWPDPDWMDVSRIKEEARLHNGKYAILGGDWSPFWHDAIDFLGMENFFIKMYTEPEIVDSVLQHIVDYYIEVSRRIFDVAGDEIDIFFIGNDFGSQAGPLISPDLFKRYIFPQLRRFVDLGHDYDLKVQLHCCGGIWELLPQLIETGVDALHAVQPDCIGMDLLKIKSEFGNKICFNGGIDSKKILIDGTPGFVKEQTRRVLNIMKPGGGYIAGASHDTILEETPVENVLAMFDAIREFGMY
jgi:uroporphyrinogen decarboxylase